MTRASATRADHRIVDRCRVCGSAGLWRFLDLGEMPLANAFVPADRAGEPERRYPLAVQRCRRCGLVQLTVVVRPEILFRNYRYASSASAPMLEHFRAYAAEIVPGLAPPGVLVVEVGSNDGILLRPLAERGARVLGIEPAENLAALANASGYETWPEFFSSALATRIREERGPAAAIVANNVLAHIDDLPDVARAVSTLLGPSGVFIAQFPYLPDLLASVEYDTIYHEHLAYFSLAPLRFLFALEDLEIVDARRLSIHGGSIRIQVRRRGQVTASPQLRELAALEERLGLDADATYDAFARDVARSREALVGLVSDLHQRGAALAGYGATAKGNTLLNYCGIGTPTLAFIADTTTLKQGLLTPGTHIPVVPDAALLERRPDYTLLLAWNYADSIVRRQSAYVRQGGRFIHPIPMARILEP